MLNDKLFPDIVELCLLTAGEQHTGLCSCCCYP